MSNVIDLLDYNTDLKACSYYDENGNIGVIMRDRSLTLIPLNKTDIELRLGDESFVFNRNQLAEFLNIASVLLDSEQRFFPDFDLAGLNYEQ